jgi:hypothetical protein
MGEYVNSGRLVSHVEDKITLIAIAEDSEKAHFLTNAANAVHKINEVAAVQTQPGNGHYDHYMRGMANGLILAQSIVNNEEPDYIDADKVEVFDYMAEADKTCSIVWNPGYVNAADMAELLATVITAAEDMNRLKKLFFRGKAPSDVGLKLPTIEDSLDGLSLVVDNDDINIIHGIVGIITEAGEMAELLRDYLVQGKPFDRVHVLEEAGDVYWYLARALRGIGANLELMGTANIDKLHGRHGTSFDVFRDANRDLIAERAKLETAAIPLFEEDPDNPDQRPAVERLIDEAEAPPVTPVPGGCVGTDFNQPPEPGLIWQDGCWRREIVRDVPGLA